MSIKKRIYYMFSVFGIILLIYFQMSDVRFAFAKTSVDDGVEKAIANNDIFSIENYIEDGEWEYVEEYADEYIECAILDDDMGLDENVKANDCRIGDPFVIYYPDTIQESIHYYPVIYENEILYMIDVTQTNEGYSMGIGEEFVDFLNDIDYINKPAILYYYNTGIYAENEEDTIDSGMRISIGYEKDYYKQNKFQKKTFQEKVKEINSKVSDFKKVNVKKDNRNVIYKTSVYNTLHNPMGQYKEGMCWAAAAATIINYENLSAVTAYDVCNTMNINYDDGGDMTDIKNALKKYEVTEYTEIVNGAVSWQKLVQNINSKYLLAAGGYNEDIGEGHAVTIMGYDTNSNNNKYKIWNSANNSGYGGYTMRTYNTGICCVVAGYSYQWNSTLYVC